MIFNDFELKIGAKCCITLQLTWKIQPLFENACESWDIDTFVRRVFAHFTSPPPLRDTWPDDTSVHKGFCVFTQIHKGFCVFTRINKGIMDPRQNFVDILSWERETVYKISGLINHILTRIWILNCLFHLIISIF